MSEKDTETSTSEVRSYKGLVLQAMVSMGAADGQLDRSEQETICRLYEQVTGDGIGELEVAVIYDHRKKAPTQFAAELAKNCRALDMQSKETILKAAYLVLLADGHIAARERKKLKDFAAAMKISEIHYGAILEDLSSLSGE